MAILYLKRLTLTFSWLTAGLACVICLWTLWLSRYQPIEWDLAMMHYVGFLLNEKGFILYRNIFENNLPGAFLFHAILGQILGYDALPLRLLDFAILGCLASGTWLLVSPVSRPAALLAPCLFIAVYLYTGSMVALQRDYLGILPVLLATYLTICHRLPLSLRALLAGALAGFACGFKPNFILTVPALWWLLMREQSGARALQHWLLLIPLGCGFTIIFAIPLLWGLYKADYQVLLEIYKTFTPIYVQSRTDLYHYQNTSEQLLELGWKQLRHLVLITVLAAPGLCWAWLQRNTVASRKHLYATGLMTFVFAWHELIAGKFWLAHLLPSIFWACICFSLILTKPREDAKTSRLLLSLFLVICCTLCSGYLIQATWHKTAHAGYSADNDHIRSHKIARFLQQHLKQGDTVQGFDGSGDAQGSLLLARATLATRFPEDIPFFMQPEQPATQAFRREFLQSLNEEPPAYFVYPDNLFHPAGSNRLKEFKALWQFIEEHYEVAEFVPGEYTIYALKETPEN